MTEPFIRPPLIIKAKPKKHKYFVQFEPATGKVIGALPYKSGNCIEVDEYLGSAFIKGTKILRDYEVLLIEGQHTIVSKKDSVATKDNNVEAITVVENKFLHEVKYNNTDSCIRFKLSKNNKKFIVTIDDTLATSISDTIDMTKTNVCNFFTTDQDNTSIVDKILEIDLNYLIKNKKIEIDYVANFIPRLFCRKLYNYSYEVADEF